jgi:AhpD family alkylhydroperoxidase
MQARMNNPVLVLPETLDALIALGKAVSKGGIPVSTLELVNLRASQINSCGVCIQMHSRDAKKGGETDERLFGLAAWRDAPYYTDAERAAFALTEAMTRLSDHPEAVSDEIWAEASQHYDEVALASLVVAIASINTWNRINNATRQVAGSF